MTRINKHQVSERFGISSDRLRQYLYSDCLDNLFEGTRNQRTIAEDKVEELRAGINERFKKAKI